MFRHSNSSKMYKYPFYARFAPATLVALKRFRDLHPPRQLDVHGIIWNYLVLGQGKETVLFLHGMAGAYDIWWQQMDALQARYRVISLTYPPVDTLGGLYAGIRAILAREQVESINVVGTSLGGYLAQYLVTRDPHLVKRAVFANTFPPNDVIAARTRLVGKLLPYLPAWLIMGAVAFNTQFKITPASGYSELVRAYQLEQASGMMNKEQFISRYRCVVEPFTPPHMAALGIPVMIIEADNDPLVEPQLQNALRQTYPGARLISLHAVGHFPYLNAPEQYTQILKQFLG